VWKCGTRNGHPIYVCGVARDGEEPPQAHTRSGGRWPTRVEAAAHLWVAVTQAANEPVRQS
jgi:hypothetical protein